jgi:DNA-binding transcriptional ArsR family regulator
MLISLSKPQIQAALCCPPTGAGIPLTSQAIADLATRLKAIADPVRLRLLTHLLDQPDFESCTCILAPVVNLSEPTVSHHLKKLEASGLLTKERRGMSVFYRVVPESIHSIASALHFKC